MKKVLVVDDEVAITDGLTALFEMESIEAAGAYDREMATGMIEAEFYPIILADLRLRTQEEGLQLLDDIREMSPGSKVASLTAFATPEMEEELLRRGSVTVLRKPMEFEEIV
ncbi:MAG TPA: response regulator, partial [Thermoanaerobaculia bacterium]|nr:response regulator [Thermoanaerobaculia bacterium]